MELEEVVHIRHIIQGNKYQIVAPLRVTLQNVEINKQIVAECHSSHTIGSLLEKLKKAITDIIRDKFEQLSIEFKIELDDVEICLRRKRQQGYKNIPNELAISVIIIQDHKTLRLKILDREFPVRLNVPTITNLLLPPVLYAPYAALPIKFDGLNIKNINCKFDWFKSKDKIVWEFLERIYFYPMKMNDVGYFLKLRLTPVSKDNVEGPYVEVISQDVVQKIPELPQDCPFELRHHFTNEWLSEESYRIVSYNTLSYRYTYYNDTYSYCRDQFMSIDYRKRLLMKEIEGYNADIICLQEIDLLEYFGFFNHQLKHRGYAVKYYRKGFYLDEGLLCAVRTSRFKLRSYEQIVFSHALKKKPKVYELLYNILSRDEDLFKKFSLLASSMMILTLKTNSGGKILVANIHLSHHPMNDDVRLIHTFMAIRFLTYSRERLRKRNPKSKVNIILCGDFNSPPGSPAYNFLCNGKVEPEEYLKVSGKFLEFRHNLNLKSACGIPKYTTYTPHFKDCIDYIFIEEDTQVDQVIPFLDYEVEKYMGIPNQDYPSDHLASVVDITFE